MAKAPAFQFYVKDWLSDPLLRQATTTSRGVWIDILCYMWMEPERSGRLKVTPMQLARLACGGDINESLHFINDLWDLKFGDIKFDENVNFPFTEENSNTNITLINRRMYNDYLNRKGGRERQAKYREKGGGDPEHWTAIRIKILKRDESMCAYCGRKADTVDHVIPKTKGGDESDDNLVACCKRCNMKKGDRTLKESKMSFWKGYLKIKHQNNTNGDIKITPPSTTTTALRNDLSKDKSPAGDHFKNKIGEYLNVVLAEIDLIHKYKQNGTPLNQRTLFQWVQEKSNQSGHPKAIFRSLSWLRELLERGENVKSFRAMAETTFQTVNPKFHGRDSEAESDAFKNIVIENKQIKELLEGVGNE